MAPIMQLGQMMLVAVLLNHPSLVSGVNLKKAMALANAVDAVTPKKEEATKALYLWLENSGCTDTSGNDFDSWYNDNGLGTLEDCEASCNQYPECLGYELWDGKCYSNRFDDNTRPNTTDPNGVFQKHWDAGIGVAPMSGVSMTDERPRQDCYVKLTRDVTNIGSSPVITHNGTVIDEIIDEGPITVPSEGDFPPFDDGYPIDGPIDGYPIDGPGHPEEGPTYGGVQVTGDPHVKTFRQKHFDLHYRGTVKLLELTSVALPQEVLLQVNGTTGGSTPCGAQYLKEIFVTGQWTQGKKHDFRANRRKADPTSKHHKARMTFGPGISFVVSHGVTDTGVVYLNLRTSSLAVAGVHVGGLLGDEDFSWAARAPEECQ